MRSWRQDGFVLRLCVLAAAAGGALASLEMAKIRREGGTIITSSTLGWAHADGVHVPHAVPVTEDDPATVWCRAEKHGTWVAGAMHSGTCTVPFLGSVLQVTDSYEVLVSLNGSSRVRYENWDRYLAPPHNAVSVEVRRFLAMDEGEDGFPQAGYLSPQERRAFLVAGPHVDKVDAAMVLVEDQPVRYDLRAVSLDTSRIAVTHEEEVLAEARLLNPGPSRQHVVEAREVVVTQLAYWGQLKGTYTGLDAHVVSPPPSVEERELTWGVQNELDNVHNELLEYNLPPGTGVWVKLIGTVRKTEAPYSGTLTSVYRDGSQSSRVVEGLHMDQRLVQLHAQYSSPYFLFNNTELDIPEQVSVLYKSTTTTTTTTTTSSNRQSQQKSSSPSNIRSSHNHHSSSSSSSTTSSSKHLPVLQKVVTSFTTSEPQTVHFGMASSQQGHLQRSEALSHLKTQTTSSSSSYSNMSVPPPPSATQHWNNNNTASSLATGHSLHASLVSLGSSVGSSVALGSPFDPVPNSRPARPPAPSNGQSRSLAGGALSFVNPLSADRNDGVQSTSSSSESLSSRSSRELPQPLPSSLSSSPQTSKRLPLSGAPPKLGANGPHRDYRVQQTNHFTYNSNMKLGAAYPPTYRQHIETNSISGSQSTLLQSSNSSPPPSSANAASNGTVNFPPRKVRTLYACVGENDSELSFEPNQVLTNVRPSREPGWLEGTLNGRTGLVPENYVENIEDKPPPPLHMPQRNTDV